MSLRFLAFQIFGTHLHGAELFIREYEGPDSPSQPPFSARSWRETVPPAPFLAVVAHAPCVWSTVVYRRLVIGAM